MAFAKRIFLFLFLNFLVIFAISCVLDFLQIQPYLSSYGLSLNSLMIFCLIWGMGGALISLALSRVMAKWLMNVEVIDSQTRDPELGRLLSTVHTLARRADLPMPQVGIYHSNEVNAFATGPTRTRALIAVSTGLLARMKEQEVEAILGHEISHIANGDMVTMTLLQGVVNAFVMFLARLFAYAAAGLGRSRQSNQDHGLGSYVLFSYLFQFVFMILGSLLIAAFSRRREFKADAGGASLAGKDAMISALESLKALSEMRDPRTDNPAMAAFKISHPGKLGLLRWFATHPPLEERIERLRA
jgi:heat shock protein HtpX